MTISTLIANQQFPLARCQTDSKDDNETCFKRVSIEMKITIKN